MMNRYRVALLTFVAALFLTVLGCAYPISSPLRQMARKDLTPAKVEVEPQAVRGATVIWGGLIMQTENQTTGTAIFVLGFPLDWQGRPKIGDESTGRFIVTSPDFLDPAIYRRGRQVIVAGEITDSLTQPVNGAHYHYPVLAARQIHLWRRYLVYNSYSCGYPPYWTGPWCGYYSGPYYYYPPTWWRNIGW